MSLFDEVCGERSQADLLGEFLYRANSGSDAKPWRLLDCGGREFWRERARRVMAGGEAFPVIPEGRQETLGG